MSSFRIGGLASGLDTNSLIDQLIAIERKPVQLLQTKKQTQSWKKSIWGDIETSLGELNKSAQALLKRATMMARSTSTTDDEIATATATSDAAHATYSVNVSNLATSSKLTSGLGIVGIGMGGAIDPNQPISSYLSKFETNPTAGTFTVNGATFTLTDNDSDSRVDKIEVKNSSGSSIFTSTNATGITLNEVVAAFNNGTVSAATGVTASYSATTDKLSIAASTPGGNLNLGGGGDTSNFLTSVGLLSAQRTGDEKSSVAHLGRVRTSQILSSANFATAMAGDADGNGKFSVNGVEISYNVNTDSLKTIIDRINSSSAGVNATYDSIQDRLIMTNKNTGSLAINRADVTGNFFAAADMLTGASETAGSNAIFTVTGINGGNSVSSASNNVTGLIAGVTLNLKKEGTASIAITQDTTKAKESITDFVNKYNATITLINSKLSEEKVKDPTTVYDSMKGILRGDRQLAEIKSSLVNKSISTVAGLPLALDQLGEIGITLDKTDFGKASTLVLDSSKLEDKLSENAGAVANLFFSDADGDGKIDSGDSGVAARLSGYMDSLLTSGGSSTINRAEDTATGITYNGTWSTIPDAGASGETVKRSSTNGDYVEFSFTGTEISWFATKDVDLGIAKIFIDGVYDSDVDLYSATKQNAQRVFTKASLGDSLHTIKVEVTSSKNADSTGYGINIDAMDITHTNSEGTISRQLGVLQADIDDIDDQVERMEARLEKREQTLVAKFSAMEAALQRIQQMSASFEQQLSALGQ